MTQKKQYTKSPKPIEELLLTLKSRGLSVHSDEHAHRLLRHVGYYRLSGYTLLLEVPGRHVSNENGKTVHVRTHQFQEGATFLQVARLYDLDRRLRIHVLDAIERIEVSFRSMLCDHMSLKYRDPHWYLDNTKFKGRYRAIRENESPDTLHGQLLERISKETCKDNSNNRNAFCNHYYENYSSPELPPCWMVAEQLSFGAWSIIFENLAENQDRKAVADVLHGRVRDVESWMRALSYLRNLCAHHARLIGVNFVQLPRISTDFPSGLQPSPGTPDRSKKFIAFVAVIHYLLQYIYPDSGWTERTLGLLNEFDDVDLERFLGFYENWHTDPFWRL